jgi:hypothetical protein
MRNTILWKDSEKHMIYIFGSEWKMESLLSNILFKYPVALIYLYTQYDSVNNATISISPSLHNMFRPQMAIIGCLS